MSETPTSTGHAIAVIGGATAGAEMAGRLAARGHSVVVFDQNPRPYGKVEDGLPRWHVALRKKEYASIDGKLAQPGVHFVPLTSIGTDVPFRELAEAWGFAAVVLACGAWRDRPLPIEGAERYVGRGIVYQNPFIIWFNHAAEAAYQGERFSPEDGVIVVGGGLASIDVVKVLMLETTRAKLAERGIEATMIELEVKGIPKILATHDLAWEDLGLEGATLFYRRRAEDMPVVDIPEGASEERAAKVRKARIRVLEKAMEKYRFNFEPLSSPDGLITGTGPEGDRVVGLRFRRTRIENGRVIATDETFEHRGRYVVGSIGSIPAPLEGLPMKGELFAFSDWELGRIEGFPTLFSAGNVVTGKGNIVASRKHAALVEEQVERFLGLDDAGHADEDGLLDAERERAAALAREVAEAVEKRAALPPDGLEQLLARVQERQRAVGYGGDYRAWIEKVTPPDLE